VSIPGAEAPAGPGALAAAWPRSLVGEVSLIVLEQVDSTQALVRVLLERHFRDDETPWPFLVVALEQTAGRGRRGRAWQSAAGLGLWASLALEVPAGDAQSLPMRAGVALAGAVNGILGGACRLKWPNDLVAGHAKLGGLLIDVLSRSGGGVWAVIGFGLNCGHGDGELPGPGSASLRTVLAGGRPPALPALLANAAVALWREVARPREGWLERYRSLSAHALGDEIACDLADGRVAGRFAGFDEHGFLLLEVGTGRRVIRSGEVFAW
jgi:BirA family biotin operon repressor/biotin-[acetyl-CoA-carboxylase] ligase